MVSKVNFGVVLCCGVIPISFEEQDRLINEGLCCWYGVLWARVVGKCLVVSPPQGTDSVLW